MELQRGVCSLCSENNKVFAPTDTEEVKKFLPRLLHENFLAEAEKIRNAIKICPICYYKVETTNQIRKAITEARSESDTKDQHCHFCKTDKCIMKIKSDWKYFNERTEGLLTTADFPVCVCPSCLFYFDVIYNIKTKLLYKFPQLGIVVKSKSPVKQNNDTPKRKSLSKSPPSSKKRKIFNNCFAYLQPLCNNNYQVSDKLKTDIGLYKKIPYVNLKNVKDVTVKETPKVRPVIKIKLKPPRSKKLEKEKTTPRLVSEVLQEKNFKSQPYVKLCKSEEILKVSHKNSRRLSCENQSVEESEALDETPKAASAASLVPKRRVSLFIEEEDKLEPPENDSEEINDLIDKYIGDCEKPASPEAVEISAETNGIEEIVAESVEREEPRTDDTDTTDFTDNTDNERDSGEVVQEVQKLTASEDSDSSSSSESAKSEKMDNSEGSDSDASYMRKNNPDRESLNGSERKKKRVTFSDEIN